MLIDGDTATDVLKPAIFKHLLVKLVLVLKLPYEIRSVRYIFTLTKFISYSILYTVIYERMSKCCLSVIILVLLMTAITIGDV